MTLRVVRAFRDGYEVVAVNCSPLPSRPWTAIDVAKGWTIACRDDDLTDQVELFTPFEAGAWLPPRPDAQTEAVTGGRAPEGQLQALADIIGVPDLPRIVDEGLAKIERGIKAAFDEGQWRVTACDDPPFTGEAPEAWAYFADRIDRYGFIDRIEHRVDDTWRIRSVRDLLAAAGGDPL